uniref:Palmitoyltransferase n=1 Tax=Hucho hucho TaxID=62062 RepID=A0A4W5QZ14_9TELE
MEFTATLVSHVCSRSSLPLALEGARLPCITHSCHPSRTPAFPRSSHASAILDSPGLTHHHLFITFPIFVSSLTLFPAAALIVCVCVISLLTLFLSYSLSLTTVTKKRHAGQLQLVKLSQNTVCDHHCVRVNNCIRAQNTWYLLLYLLSVCVMAVDMVLLTGDMLLHAVVDDDGQQRQAGMLFGIQHLFLIFLRIVFMLGFLVFVFKLLAGYALFHTYLALVNQTSNEWYKGRGNVCQHCHPSPDHFCGPPASYQSKSWLYSRGVLRNLGYFWSCIGTMHWGK